MKSNANVQRINRPQDAPKSALLAQQLLRDIADEGLRPGDRLGTEEELGIKHNASRFTVRRALSSLAEEGYVSREKARGTFVRMTPDLTHTPVVVQGTILVVCSNRQTAHAEEDVAFATVLRSMESTLARLGYFVQIIGLGEDIKTDIRRLRHVVQDADLRGVVAIGPCIEPYLEIVQGLPTVFTGYFCRSGGALVGDDVRVVCRESVRYLLAQGHRDVAVVCGPWVEGKAFGLFVEGCREAYETMGLRFRRCFIHHAYPGESLVELVCGLLDDRLRPTAVFGEDWRVCEAILAATRRLGLRIPEDLSVLGYGQNVLHLSYPVAVSAYVPDSAGIGRKAAEVLTEMVEGKTAEPSPVMIHGRLVERESVLNITS